MNCFPKIDQPCPLGVDALKRLNGYCGVCRKTVHALDGLDAGARSSLLANASGPICVSYRVPARIGTALMLTLVGAAFANEATSRDSAAEATTVQATEQIAPAIDDVDYIVAGGIRAPQEADWIDTDVGPLAPQRSAIADDAQQTRGPD